MAYTASSNENVDFTIRAIENVHDINEVKVTNEEYEFTLFGVQKIFDINDKSTSRRLLGMGVG
ncbi:MAG: hypothetical protein CMB80_05615 [Flammeovirgaceae bacterium]|nr:hypothetical protein [Flammeovirgaceae bacterium]|tara:strand:- start:2934 stop:3122 length:189 start_codon:yes stop_codon:yes gene_type:complete